MLQLIPDVLIGIRVGRIRRNALRYSAIVAFAKEFLHLRTTVDRYVVSEDVKETIYLGEELFEEHYRVIFVHVLFRDDEVEMSFLCYSG